MVTGLEGIDEEDTEAGDVCSDVVAEGEKDGYKGLRLPVVEEWILLKGIDEFGGGTAVGGADSEETELNEYWVLLSD